MNVLTIDVGNSTISVGLFQNNHLTHRWSLNTIKDQSAGFYFDQVIAQNFLESRLSFRLVDEIILSSVVPEINADISKSCEKLFDAPFLLLQPELFRYMEMDFINPLEIGTDIVANLVHACKTFRKMCLVVDFGTALTFSVVNAGGKAEGVAILPGIRTAMQSLFSHTSQLPHVPIEPVKEILGKDTVSAIQSGIIHGYTGLVHHIITKIKSKYSNNIFVVATGGLAGILEEVNPHFDLIDKDFTLKGLYTIWTLVRKKQGEEPSSPDFKART